ncbi:MAG TPA: hypothetical protein VH596_06065 [Terriglobales bacterium]|jgi:hypothetical protein
MLERAETFCPRSNSILLMQQDRVTCFVAKVDQAPELAWYVFTIAIIGTGTCLKLFPHHRPARRYEQYREAWDLMSDSMAPPGSQT